MHALWGPIAPVKIAERLRRFSSSAAKILIAILGRRRPIEISVSFSPSGIAVFRGDAIRRPSESQFPWDAVQRVVAYKRDLLTTDLICMDFELVDRTIVAHEEMAGWDSLVRELPRWLPGAVAWGDVEGDVMLTAFATNEICLFDRNSARGSTRRDGSGSARSPVTFGVNREQLRLLCGFGALMAVVLGVAFVIVASTHGTIHGVGDLARALLWAVGIGSGVPLSVAVAGLLRVSVAEDEIAQLVGPWVIARRSAAALRQATFGGRLFPVVIEFNDGKHFYLSALHLRLHPALAKALQTVAPHIEIR